MSDIINHIPNENGESELWITIKDASDLLGISERHAWNIISKKGFQTKKLLNKSRKKSYVLRSDIEKYHKDEQERQRLEALGASSLSEKSEISEMSERKGEIEISERASPPLSERDYPLSERAKSLPALLKEAQDRQERLIKASVRWRVTTLWVSVLGLVIAGFLLLSMKSLKQALSERETRLSEREQALSESRKALSEMSERVFAISEREREAVKTAYEQRFFILELQKTIETLKQEEVKDNEQAKEPEGGGDTLPEPRDGHL